MLYTILWIHTEEGKSSGVDSLLCYICILYVFRPILYVNIVIKQRLGSIARRIEPSAYKFQSTKSFEIVLDTNIRHETKLAPPCSRCTFNATN